SLLAPPPSSSPLFPYTTLFRSAEVRYRPKQSHRNAAHLRIRTAQYSETIWRSSAAERFTRKCLDAQISCIRQAGQGNNRGDDVRSEEHTSELQSRENLVCRLLL